MKKRILGIILAILMVAALLPMAALADGEVAEIEGGAKFATLQAAVNAANDGDTVKLLANVELSGTYINITKGITIDFGEFVVSGVNCKTYPQALFQIKASGKTVTFKGTTGGIDAQAGDYGTRAIAIEAGSKLVIEGGVYNSMNNCTIYADNAGVELVMNGGEINTQFTKVGTYKQSVVIKGDLTIANATIKNEATNASGNVIDEKADNAKVSIVDSKIDAKNITAAVAATSTSTVEIKGTEVTTTSANLVNGGNITIGEGTNFVSDTGRIISGATTAAIEGGSFKTNNTQNGAFGNSSFPLDIKGGSFDVAKLTSSGSSTNLKISGGEFKIKDETNAKQVKDNYLAPTEDGGEVQVEINETAYTVNEEGKVEEFIPVAQIGEKEYDSLAKAINAAMAANEDVTVEIIADIDLEKAWTSIKPVTGKSGVVTINGNGKTVTGLNAALFESGVGSKSGLVINNLTISGADIYESDTETNGVAAFIAFLQADQDITLNGCAVVDSIIAGGNWGGGLIGAIHGYTPVSVVTIKDCTVSGCTISSNSAGALIGHANQSGSAVKIVIDNATATNNTIIGEKVAKTGLLIGTIGVTGNTPVELNATESGNKTYVGDEQIANPTVAGRIGSSGGAMTVTGGSYTVDPTVVSDPATGTVAPKKDFEIKQNENGTYGVEELPDVAKIGDTKYTSLADAMNAAKAGETVELLCDIDLAGENWTPIADFKATLDGKGFTIKNMTVNDTANAYAGFVCLLSGTIKNVNFDNASVTGQRVGVVAGSNGAWTNAVIENVNVTNSKVFGEQKCGGIMGFVRGVDNTGVGTLTVKGCSVENLVLDAAGETVYQAGGLLGYVDYGVNLTVEGCSVKNIVINNDGYSSDECKDLTNPLYASNEFIGVVNNKVTGSVKDYDQFTIALKDNSMSGELNDIRREACNEECSLIGGYYNFLDGNDKDPTKIVVDEAELTDELGINQEAALAELEALVYTTDEAKVVIEEAKAAVAEAETVEEVNGIVAQAKIDADAAEELALAKVAAVAELEAYIAELGIVDDSFAAAEIEKINAAEDLDAVAQALADAKAAAEDQDAAEELAAAKEAAVTDFNAYVASLNLKDTSFAAAQIENINAAANKAAVAEALAAANAAAKAQKDKEDAEAAKALADAKAAAIAELEAVVGDNEKQSVKDMLQSYIDQINAATSISAVKSIVPAATSALKQQIEIADEGSLVSAIRNFVNAVDRNDYAKTNKVMGIIKPILKVFGIK